MSLSAISVLIFLCSLATTFSLVPVSLSFSTPAFAPLQYSWGFQSTAQFPGRSATPAASSTQAGDLRYTWCAQNDLCRNQSGVECRGRHCRCAQGYIGNGHIACADPVDHCVCTMSRDPHVVSSTGRRFHLPIPCAHTIADFTTPVIGGMVNTGNCHVDIRGLAYNPRSNNSFNYYERQVDIRVNVGNDVFTARINAYRDAVIGGNWPGMVSASSNGSTLITIPMCGLEIAYRSDGFFFSLVTSRQASGYGLCDNCQDYGPRFPRMRLLAQLLNQLNHLTQTSPIDGKMMNRVEWCNDLNARFNACPSSKKVNAVQFCGSLLVDRRYTACIQQRYGNADLATRSSIFDDCLLKACNPSTPCNELRDEFWWTGCPTSHLPTLSNFNFCI